MAVCSTSKRLSFFLPSRLIDFEYFTGDSDIEYEEMAKPYRKDIDFAFFVVNFGYSKADYEALTLREKLFIYKAWENKQVMTENSMYNAMYVAGYNLHRPKNKRALKLIKKKTQHKADMRIIESNFQVINEVEDKEGKDWLARIYQENNMRLPERRSNG